MMTIKNQMLNFLPEICEENEYFENLSKYEAIIDYNDISDLNIL